MKHLYLFFIAISTMLNAQQCDTINLVWDGDSNFAQNPVYDVWYPNGETPCQKTAKILRGVGYNIVDTNLAVSGNNIYSIRRQMDGIEKFVKKDRANILVFNGFHNSAGTANIKGEEIAKVAFDIVKQAKQKGFQKVFVLTAHAVDFVADSYPYYCYDSINPKRLIFNRIIRDSAQQYGYQVIDISADSRYKDSSACRNEKYYRNDRLHLNGYTGSQAYAEIMSRAIDMSLCKKSIISAVPIVGQLNALKIYPNPCFNQLYVEDAQGGVEAIDVSHNPLGVNVMKWKNGFVRFVKIH